MYTGYPPFKGQSEVLLFEAICRKKPLIRRTFSSNFKNIILNLLQKNPIKRLGSFEIKQHPWFDEINFDSIYKQQIPSPFYENVLIKSLSNYRQEAIKRNEKPLLIADQDDYTENFKDF
ncbi:unnamed protein product [Adineta steineri]|uniref:Protein kinase domain-containing protein n=2 Tax=Adineta steineri TaxID=433720 RepID=A0A815DAM8_9BILA|nr:unnamed protein product [Adineta steineri]